MQSSRILSSSAISFCVGALAFAPACSSSINANTSDGGSSGDGGAGGGSAVSCPLLGEQLFEGTAPIERGDMAFAVDPACSRVYMWYGDGAIPVNCQPSGSQFLNEGYAYDVSTGLWSTIVSAGTSFPIERARSRGVWDAKRRRFILFGGRYRAGGSGSYTFLNDLWAFDPETREWTELSAQDAPGAPSGRMNFTMDADPERDRILVHGGGTTDFSAFTPNNETWAFDLATNAWSQIGLAGTLPTARLFHVSAFDRAGSRLYIFGGGGADAFVTTSFMSDTWVLDLSTDTWSEVQSTTRPAGRIKAELLYDAERTRLVMFGGHDDTSLGNTNDVWTLDLQTGQWASNITGDTFNAPALGFCDFPSNFATVDPTSPERRESHLFDSSGGTAVMYGGRTDCGLARDTWELDLATLTWIQINESAVGMTCYRSGSLTCDDPDAKMCI